MKNFNTYINEKLIISKNKLKSKYKYHPNDKNELIDIIIEHIRNNNGDLNDIDVSEITDMYGLFESNIIRNNKTNDSVALNGWGGDVYVDCSEWDMSNVDTIERMFYQCNYINTDFSNWDTSHISNMEATFLGIDKFEGKGLENWDVSNVKSMSHLFSKCTNLNVNLKKWDVSNVENMNYMFYGCKNFKYNISNWDVSKVNTACYMFTCSNIPNNYRPKFKQDVLFDPKK